MELRSLPSVHNLAAPLEHEPRALAARTARGAIAGAPERIGAGEPVGDLERETRDAYGTAGAVVGALR